MTEGILAAVIATRPSTQRAQHAPILSHRVGLIVIWLAFALVVLYVAAYFIVSADVADKLSHPLRRKISE